MTRRGAKAVSLPPIDATPEEIAQSLFSPRPVKAVKGDSKRGSTRSKGKKAQPKSTK